MKRVKARFSLQTLPEVFVSNAGMSAALSRAVAAGKLRKLASRLYTRNLTETPASLVRRHLWDIVGGYFPGGLVADRTALEQRPAADGSVFLVAEHGREVSLPGLTLRARAGMGPRPGDFPLRDGVLCMSTARALLENMRPSRARSGVARTWKRGEIEAWLERFVRDSGKERVNTLRDAIKAMGPDLGLATEAEVLDGIIGALLGTREVALASPVARARARGASFDARRVELFEQLSDALRRHPPEPVRTWRPVGDAAVNQAFFEAYFSNFIEGTEFPVDQAEDIVFGGIIPPERPADAHDIRGTFALVSDAEEMRRLPANAEELLDLLRRRHAVIMKGRPEKTPGVFKDRANQFGAMVFVAPEDVKGTLSEGFRIHQRLSEPLHRAVFMMFMVSEVHPFLDGNGRLARVMMNAELAAADQVRVLIPIVYRNNYIAALRALSGNGLPEPIIKALAFAQRYVAAVPWGEFDQALSVLERTHAMLRPEEADDRGLRLTIPTVAEVDA